MNLLHSLVVTTTLLASMAFSGLVLADLQEGGNRTPPQAAIDACSDKAAGDTCNFTGRFNDVREGTCRKPPSIEQVVCVPKPPQQAFDACQGKSLGEQCSFTGPQNKAVNGVCRMGPRTEGKIACGKVKPQTIQDTFNYPTDDE